MKNLLISYILILVIIFNVSCHNNHLKINQQDLEKEIIKGNGNSIDEKIALEKGRDKASNKTSIGLRFKEIRTVDPSKPPIKIDIAGNQDNIRRLMLSDIGSSVRYIKLQTPPDTSMLYDPFFFRNDLNSNVRSDGEQIIFQGIFGLTRYNMQGQFQETIWKNETGIKFYGNSMVAIGEKDFFGVPFYVPVSIGNGDLYFTFQDGPNGKGQVMKYKTGTDKTISAQTLSEIQGLGIIHGDTLLNTDRSIQRRFDEIYSTSHETWAGVNNKWNAGTTGTFLVSYNSKGDTLCQFADFERIVNFNYKDGGRNAVKLTSYLFNNFLTIKQEYNDTVFRVIPPNILLPVYIIDFGKFKFNYIDGFNPNFDLSGKLMLNSLNETKEFLIIRYTQNYDCPLTRKGKMVKFYYALFNKKEGKIYHNPGFSYLPEGIVNDIDGGLPFWPDFVTPQGEMMKLVSGRVLKDYITSEVFKASKLSQENRQKLISMTSGLKNTDMIVMLVK